MIGFAVMAVSCAMGALTGVDTSMLYIASWFALAGIGLGLSMPTAMNAALGALTVERVGSGSALISAMRQVGATIGVAILGTVISATYHDRIDVTGLSDAQARAARDSVGEGVSVARSLDSRDLLASVHAAFTDGLDLMLWTCAGISLVGALAAYLFLPRERPAAPPAKAPDGEKAAEQPA
jgi:MFS family permease